MLKVFYHLEIRKTPLKVMKQYNLVAENPESTVVTEYQSLFKKEITYQSEAGLEKAFVELLQTQAYEYLTFTTEQQLISNLRNQLEILNDYRFPGTNGSIFFTMKSPIRTTVLRKRQA